MAAQPGGEPVSNPLTEHDDAEAPVNFGALWRAGAVLAFGMLSFITVGLFTWGVWVTMAINRHDKQIAVLQERSGGKGISQSVNVGEVKDAAGKLVKESAKTWLTTKDVAERQGITERTVLNYIENGMIEPTPVKNGKSWEIAENFRIVPHDSEECGIFPNETSP